VEMDDTNFLRRISFPSFVAERGKKTSMEHLVVFIFRLLCF
jgi:hypothetical protein